MSKKRLYAFDVVFKKLGKEYGEKCFVVIARSYGDAEQLSGGIRDIQPDVWTIDHIASQGIAYGRTK